MGTTAQRSDVVGRLDLRMLVGGARRGSQEAMPTYDPSTGEVIAEVPVASAVAVADAVEAAATAQPAWARTPVKQRAAALQDLAGAIREHADDLALLDAVNSGNPLPVMRQEVDIALSVIDYWAAMVHSLHGRTLPLDPDNHHYTLHEPYGVVGRIVPFNHPLLFAINMAASPLITGNAVVMKPAHQTPLSALLIAQLAQQTLPAGLLNVVPGGADTGDALVTHPAVKRIAFTGSLAVGLEVQARAATAAVKHVTLELGGKNALIACPDADLDAVVDGAVKGMNLTLCMGQSCGSTSRVFVHERLHDDFCGRLAQRLSALRVGPAYDAGIDMGPLVSAPQRDRVLDFIGRGRADGAALVTGGADLDGLDVPEGGYYVRPTMFADVDPSMSIARDEIFGPVVSVFRWSDYDRLVRQVNDVEYGLTASIWSHDVDLVRSLSRAVQAGYVWINDSATHYWGTPFGGYKNSGVGREESLDELYSYLQTKTVHDIATTTGADALARTLGAGAAAGPGGA